MCACVRVCCFVCLCACAHVCCCCCVCVCLLLLLCVCVCCPLFFHASLHSFQTLFKVSQILLHYCAVVTAHKWQDFDSICRSFNALSSTLSLTPQCWNTHTCTQAHTHTHAHTLSLSVHTHTHSPWREKDFGSICKIFSAFIFNTDCNTSVLKHTHMHASLHTYSLCTHKLLDNNTLPRAKT